MSLNIKDVAATQLVRELARETGESLTGAVYVAVRERLERLRHARARKAAVERVLRGAWNLSRLDARTPDAILGYDERGLPR